MATAAVKVEITRKNVIKPKKNTLVPALNYAQLNYVREKFLHVGPGPIRPHLFGQKLIFDNPLQHAIANPHHAESTPHRHMPLPPQHKLLSGHSNQQPVVNMSAQTATMQSKIMSEVTTIRNVYQEQYRNGHASGFGDFIRGSYFLIQICNILKIKCVVDTSNHPVSKCLRNSPHECEPQWRGRSFISHFENNNFVPKILPNMSISSDMNPACYQEFIEYTHTQLTARGIADTATILNIYVTSFPIYPVSNIERLYMRQVLLPSADMECYIQDTLNQLKYVAGQYDVIHIRIGDDYLINGKTTVSEVVMRKIKNFILSFNSSRQCLLIGDSNAMKTAVCGMFRNVKSIICPITHLGENVNLSESHDKVKNTMLDFYLMSRAKSILSLSVYGHGSGFSKWCSETYGIPYVCKYIS